MCSHRSTLQPRWRVETLQDVTKSSTWSLRVHGSVLLNMPRSKAHVSNSFLSLRERCVQLMNSCPNRGITTSNSKASCSQLHSQKASPHLHIPSRRCACGSNISQLEASDGKTVMQRVHLPCLTEVDTVPLTRICLEMMLVSLHGKKKKKNQTCSDKKRLETVQFLLVLGFSRSVFAPPSCFPEEMSNIYSVLPFCSTHSPVWTALTSSLGTFSRAWHPRLAVQLQWGMNWPPTGPAHLEPGASGASVINQGQRGQLTSSWRATGNDSVSEICCNIHVTISEEMVGKPKGRLSSVLFSTDNVHVQLSHRRQGIIS